MFNPDGSINLPILISIIAGAVVVIVLVIFFVIKSSKKKKKTHQDNVVVDNQNEWVKALGDKSNIVDAEAKGSRLIVKVNDQALVKKDELHNLGVMSVIMSKDKITLVIKEKAEKIRDLLK
ncbi:MAG: PTS transporter subunit EIIB [Bacilli bacterium]|nr:PTS transporter subunit EIIB [Bacilli bacterium]